MNPAIVFIFLFVFQLALGIVTTGFGALLCTVRSLWAYRARSALSAIGFAVGGLVGSVVGYGFVILAGLAWLAMRFAHVAPQGSEVSEHVIWAFPAGYVLGSFAGAFIGWRGAAMVWRDQPQQPPTSTVLRTN